MLFFCMVSLRFSRILDDFGEFPMIFGPFRTISSNNIQALMALLSEKGQPLDPMVCPGGLMCSRSCAILSLSVSGIFHRICYKISCTLW